MRTTLIAAVAANGVIGKNNQLPWHLPSDLKHFKRTTLGHPMLMGRKTFESFGSRPLPKRHHIILSGKPCEDSENVTWVRSLDEGFARAQNLSPELFIIGGATVYAQTLDRADRLLLSEIPHEYDGDAFFPEFGSEWQCVQGVTVSEPDELEYAVRTYQRRG